MVWDAERDWYRYRLYGIQTLLREYQCTYGCRRILRVVEDQNGVGLVLGTGLGVHE